MEHEHYNYPEALRYLAEKYHIEIVETQKNKEEETISKERDALYSVNKYATSFFKKPFGN